MDAIVYPLELTDCRSCSSVLIEGNSILDHFLSQIDISLVFVGECPDLPCQNRCSGRFDIPSPVRCSNDDKCVTLVRNMRKMEKIKKARNQDKLVFKSLITKFVDELEKRIELVKSQISVLTNWAGKLAFAHYVLAIILMYGITAEVIDDHYLYHHHRKEALKYNGNCVRIWSLPNSL